MTHEDFIAAYLETVEGDAEMVESPFSVRRGNAVKQQLELDHPSSEPLSTVVEDPEEFSMNCYGCGVDTNENGEYYMVQFEIWQTVIPREQQRKILCIGCLEGYLGRELVSEDFIEAPLNYCPSESERLMNRLGQWFRDFDGPFATDDERRAATAELGRRLDGKAKRERTKYMVTVDIDTNNIVRDGLTLARLLRVVDELHVGDTVIAHDMAEEADFFAEVVAVEGKRAYLRVNWDSIKPW